MPAALVTPDTVAPAHPSRLATAIMAAISRPRWPPLRPSCTLLFIAAARGGRGLMRLHRIPVDRVDGLERGASSTSARRAAITATGPGEPAHRGGPCGNSTALVYSSIRVLSASYNRPTRAEKGAVG